jgi:hypothetical protein
MVTMMEAEMVMERGMTMMDRAGRAEKITREHLF